MTDRATEKMQETTSTSPEVAINAAQQARRMNFITTNQLSRREAAEIPAAFDPGPEFN